MVYVHNMFYLYIYIYTIFWNPNDPCFGRKRRCFVGLAYIEVMWVPGICMSVYTLLGTNISPPKVCLKMIFLFSRWDMLVFWRGYLDVYIYLYIYIHYMYENHLKMQVWIYHSYGSVTGNHPNPREKLIPRLNRIGKASWPSSILAVGLHTTSTLEVLMGLFVGTTTRWA